MRVAEGNAGASINDVTSDEWLDTLSGTASFSGLRITLERADSRRALDEADVGLHAK